MQPTLSGARAREHVVWLEVLNEVRVVPLAGSLVREVDGAKLRFVLVKLGLDLRVKRLVVEGRIARVDHAWKATTDVAPLLVDAPRMRGFSPAQAARVLRWPRVDNERGFIRTLCEVGSLNRTPNCLDAPTYRARCTLWQIELY